MRTGLEATTIICLLKRKHRGSLVCIPLLGPVARADVMAAARAYWPSTPADSRRRTPSERGAIVLLIGQLN